MEFYTNVTKYGNKLLVRGVKNGNPYKTRLDFSPTLYIKSNKETEWRTLFDEPVSEVKFADINEAREFIEKYKEIESFNIYGNANYAHQYISDNYSNDIRWDVEKIKTYSIDIEVGAEFGFPSVAAASEEVLLITLQNNFTKEITTFGSRPFIGEENVNYILCSNESHLLKEFVIFWNNVSPDIITGWNVNFFDIPYLVRRIEKVLGNSLAKKLSPWEVVNERKIHVKGNEEICYDIFGVSILDYIDLYRKYTYTAQESYKLDHIAFVELGEKKLVNPEDNFHDFYTKHWDKFVRYNIHDTKLVDRLEDKMKLIELIITMAYNAKINYEDVFSQVRMWDNLIYNNLRQKKIVIPEKTRSTKTEAFEGAFVKEPLLGLHKWVVSFDLNSLYPHLIMQYNMSPETITDQKIHGATVEKLLMKDVDTSFAHRQDLAATANGICYRKDIRGFMPELMEQMYVNRSKYKKQMLKIEQEYQNDKSKTHLLKEISRLQNLQMAMKIALNSAYGAIGNQYFRYFDVRIAEGITTSGQLSIRWMANEFNRYMNNVLKPAEEKDYVIAIDTDSIYLSLEELVERTCAGKTDEQKIKYMDRICEDMFQPFIDTTYTNLAKYMNAYSQKMQMKREVLADTAIWVAKKRYILNVHNSEGVQYAQPKLKVSGLEMVKSSTPQVIRNKMKDVLKVILAGNEKNLQKYITDFLNDFKKLSVEEIAFPRGMNGLKDYGSSTTIYKKGTPIHVRGALLFNHLLKQHKLEKKYSPIRDGDKIKFIYLKTPNTIQENIIAFAGELPVEFNLHKYIDYDFMFEKVFLDQLETLIQPIGWSIEEKSNLEEFFG
jgi:DNA polymerase elongation subunit (family B)